MLIVGEVHTGLLRGPGPVTIEEARNLVDLVVGEPVLVSERPIAYVRSPAVPVGVDCALVPPGAGRQIRGIGTVIQRAAISGGHVAQGSAHTTFEASRASARRPWSHYLARPGVIETMGRVKVAELAEALAVPTPGTVELSALAGRILDRTQLGTRRGAAPLRSARTRLRWLAESGEGGVRVRFVLRQGDLRLMRIMMPEPDAARLAAVCEDVALHDWLLTALLEAVRNAALGVLPRAEALRRLSPVIDHLLHLWMPGARADNLAADVWEALESSPGFSRQWQTLVHRIRDQLSAGSVAAPAAADPR